MRLRLCFTLMASLVAAACGLQGAPVRSLITAQAKAPAVAGVDLLAGTVAPVPVPVGDVEFKSVKDLKQDPRSGEPQLRGGEVAVSANWPASLYATFKTDNGRTATCTAALIGPQAMLTAAHCVPTSGTVRFAYEGHRRAYTATCARHPRYTGATRDESADYGLCTVAPTFMTPTGFWFESLNTADMSQLLGKAIILTGFGCISDAVRDNPTDGKYRIGSNAINETSVSSSRLHGSPFYAPNERNNLFTADAPGVANLCPGDSGGPMFLRTPGGPDDLTSRTIVGVNSRVFYRSRTEYGSSLISAIGGPDFREWALEWAKATGVDVCGLRGSLPRCRI